MDSDVDADNYEHLYDEGDASRHDKLVEEVLKLNKTQNLRKPTRTEPTLQVSEFNLVKSITGEKGSVSLDDLTKSLKNRKSRVKISEKLKKASKNAVIPKPLEKPQANRIRRAVAYEKARLELDRWEALVTSNRAATSLSFPLNSDVKMDKKDLESFSSTWRSKTKLEQELEKHEPKVVEYHIGLEQEKFPLTMKEMMDRRKEAAKLRAFQGYKEAKARRQSKIKSKKYHRIQKKERIKQKLKEFEQLQKTDPEAALQKLEEIEKTRIEERFSLRHKSTGKWARNQQVRAKYDKESRQVLAQQLTLSRELTQKLKSNESDSEEDEVEAKQLHVDEDNPWVNGIVPGEEVTDFVNGYRKYWMEKNNIVKDKEVGRKANSVQQNESLENNQMKEKRNSSEVAKISVKKKNGKAAKAEISQCRSESTTVWKVSVVQDVVVQDMFANLEEKMHKKLLKKVEILKQAVGEKPQKRTLKSKKEKKKADLSFPVQAKRPNIDEELLEEPARNTLNTEDTSLNRLKNILHTERKSQELNIDPDKYLKVKRTNLRTAAPDVLTPEEKDVNQREIIAEAFEDDDLVQEFHKEKQDDIDKDKPKDVDLNLPGWGSWGGANIKENPRKTRRFIHKVPKELPRRDNNKGSLIINEKAQKKIKEHMVSEVPFPFKTVKDYEASVRAPIGSTFVPQAAHKRLTKPAVTTKLGTIIEPMSRDILLNKST